MNVFNTSDAYESKTIKISIAYRLTTNGYRIVWRAKTGTQRGENT